MNSMSFSPLPMLTVLGLIVAMIVLGARFSLLKSSYYFGVALWSRWLPVAATGVFIAILTVSLVMPAELAPTSGLGLGGFFSTFELVVLFLVGPLFLTRLGNVLGAASVVYCLERLLVGHPGLAPTMSLYLLTTSATVVAVLGDKMPWRAVAGPNTLAIRLREILLVSITIGSLAVVFFGLVKVYGFSKWISQTFDLALPPTVTLFLLIGLFVGWLSIALGFTRHLTIPLLALPSLFVLAYITAWPSYLLVVPFAACLSLSLVAAERRVLNRRQTGYANTVVWSR